MELHETVRKMDQIASLIELERFLCQTYGRATQCLADGTKVKFGVKG